MAGRTDWIVSLRRCEELIAARTAKAVPSLAWPREGIVKRVGSRNHHFSRALRIVLEERLLVLELLLGRLHLAAHLGHARDQRVLARRRAGPRIGEQLPAELVLRRRIHRRRLPRAVVDLDLDQLQRRAVV